MTSVVVGSDVEPGYVEITSRSQALICGSTLLGTVYVLDGAAPTIESNEITFVAWPNEPLPVESLSIAGTGSAPIVRDNTIRDGGISVGAGAAGTIERNDIAGSAHGLRVEASEPVVTGNTLHDNGTGIEVSVAAPVLAGNAIRDNGTGISVKLGGHPTIQDNTIEGNEVGVRVDSGSVVTSGGIATVVLRDNTICGNGANLDVTGGSTVSNEGGRICEDSASPSFGPTPEAPIGSPGFETVEPGVDQVTSDGAGHDFPADGIVWNIAFEPDGATWVVDDSRLFRFGDAAAYTRPERPDTDYDLTVAPDGRLWALVGQRFAEGQADFVASFDGATWHVAPPNPVPGAARALEVTSDGTVWAAWGWMEPAITVGRLRDGVWTTWQLVTGDGLAIMDMAATPAGHVWISASDGSLLRFDGASWDSVPLPGDEPNAVAGPLAAGPNGELWVYRGAHGEALATTCGHSWPGSSGTTGRSSTRPTACPLVSEARVCPARWPSAPTGASGSLERSPGSAAYRDPRVRRRAMDVLPGSPSGRRGQRARDRARRLGVGRSRGRPLRRPSGMSVQRNACL